MPHLIMIENSGERFTGADGMSVLAAMEQARCRGIPVGCRNGGCGACKVRVISSRYRTGKMSRAVVSVADEATGCVLACKTYPQSDLGVEAISRILQPAGPRPGASFSFVIPRSEKEA
jgi:ferredoxin